MRSILLLPSPPNPPALLAVLAVAGVALAPPGLAWTPAQAPSTAEGVERRLVPVPRPDLTGMAEPIRRGIEEFQSLVDGLTATPPADLRELGGTYGRLGQLYHAHGQRDAALAAYRNACRLDPKDQRWAYYLAFLYQDRGELTEAAAAFDGALKLKPDDLPTLLRLGNVHLDLNQPARARKFFLRALDLAPSSAMAHYGLGRAEAAGGEARTAIEHFEQALRLQPEASIVHYPLGLAYRRVGAMAEARSHLERRGEREVRFPDPRAEQLAEIMTVSALQAVLSLAGRREDFSSRNFLGFVVSQLGEVQGAVGYLEEAIRQRRAEGADGFELARIHFAVGGLRVHRLDDHEALMSFQAAVELDPAFEDAHLKLANALARGRRFDQAEARYDRVLALNPEAADALLRRASVRVELGREAEARADLVRLLELRPDHGQARLRLAALLVGVGEAEAAAVEYEKATQLKLADPERALAHFNLGQLHEAAGRGAEAARHYETALEFDAGLSQARLGLAAALGQMGRYGEASSLYGQVVAAEPQNEAARLGQVSALVLLERYPEVGRLLEEGVRLLPRSAPLAHLLARFLSAVPRPELRDGERAVRLAEALFEARLSFVYGETLAMALAEASRFQEAVELERTLLEEWRQVASREGDAAVTRRLAANLRRYEARQPCCASSDPGILLPPPVLGKHPNQRRPQEARP